MRLKQAINEKLHMYDQCVIALTPSGWSPNEETDALVDFLEEERERLRSELKDLEDGTHELFGSVDPRMFDPGDMSNADIATMVLEWHGGAAE